MSVERITMDAIYANRLSSYKHVSRMDNDRCRKIYCLNINAKEENKEIKEYVNAEISW